MIQEYIARAGFLLCTEGQLHLRCNHEHISLTPGMICVFAPILLVEVEGQSPDCRFLKMELPLSHIFAQRPTTFNIVSRLRIDTAPCLKLTPEQQNFFVKRLAHIEERRQHVAELGDEILRTLHQQSITLLEQQTLIEMLTCFYQNRRGELAAEPTPQQAVAFQFLIALSQQFREHRTVEYYAQLQHMTPTYFTRLFKQQTGHTPMEIIHVLTCTAARDMLSNTTLSIKEIATELGFPEQFTFRKYFKKHTGQAPTEYRDAQLNT